jgi:phosphate-selective porin OprO and OprP
MEGPLRFLDLKNQADGVVRGRRTRPSFSFLAVLSLAFLFGFHGSLVAQTWGPSYPAILPHSSPTETGLRNPVVVAPASNLEVGLDGNSTFAERFVAANQIDGKAESLPQLDSGDAGMKDLAARVADLEKALADAAERAKSREEKENEAQENAKKEKAEAERKKLDRSDVPLDKWNVKLGGHVQLDYINWADAAPSIVDANDYFSFRRLRLVADGTGYGAFDFRLQMTLEPGSGANENQFASPDVKDAYLSMNEIPGLGRVRVGNFFVPFSLEQVTNDTNNIFNERSIPSQGIFASEREVGIAIYNHSQDYGTSWASGVFFDSISDTIKTRLDDNQGYRLSGRFNWLPYYHEPSGGRYLVHTGIGILHTDDNDDLVRFRARPQIQRGPILIDSGDLLADSYTTGNLELAIVWGRITMQNEAFLSDVNFLSGSNATIGGAYSHLSYFLTGESRTYDRFGQHGAQFGRNKPFRNFLARPGGVGWGAWEAKVRWSTLNLTDINAGQYNDLTSGFNWYWSDRTRIMFDWIHPFTSKDAVFGSTESDLLAMRFDFNW